MIRDGVAHIANVGDSRAVLGYLGSDGKIAARALSIDHKPQRPSERERLDLTSAVLLTERAVRGFGDEEKVLPECHSLEHTRQGTYTNTHALWIYECLPFYIFFIRLIIL